VKRIALGFLASGILSSVALATDHHVGPGQAYASIGAVPWATLQPGDQIFIHWRPTPYAEKWVLCRQGTQAQPIAVRGVLGPNGERPVITGDGAVTAPGLNYWNEDRGVLKIGGANTPADLTPAWITVENLEIRSARPGFTFTDDGGTPGANYLSNASAIYIEKGSNLTIRNCVFHDCGNGFFCASGTSDLLVEKCHIYDNGISGSIFEHNNYTEANGITFQFNRFGPLRSGCPGNNLKDRSAGCIVRYNWIEGGNRQLDLVDSDTLFTDPDYGATFVYGNVLIEPDGAGNSQIVHYGGDSGTTAEYRKGTLHFYNNTVASTRAGNTTLFRLSTNDEAADSRNNVVYVTASGGALAMLDSAGQLAIRNHWMKAGWSDSHSGLTGTINDLGGHRGGTSPGFVDEGAQDYRLDFSSICIDGAAALAPAVLPTHNVVSEYDVHQSELGRIHVYDIGAFENDLEDMPTVYPDPPGGGGSSSGCGLLGIEPVILFAALIVRRRRTIPR
jgi:hypothetical protein